MHGFRYMVQDFDNSNFGIRSRHIWQFKVPGFSISDYECSELSGGFAVTEDNSWNPVSWNYSVCSVVRGE